ncbi:MAG: glycerol-3-phosphate dehydrogenase [Rhodospirillales bacterium]|nr:glycerol-3-phosphate dehydrogenase [Rhodospirillales bacterium]MBO6785522.1 glycerol-3-phosphate dehydrogenase [Rhodospirillales bacterium]
MYDLAVIGGGINGCGIARDAAGRGLKVLLVEKNDLASGTSSASTKLIHGGLRYLEHYEFRLVRESLLEREVLMGMAPHIIWPMRFVLPHHEGLRPAWLIRLGLFLYDHLGGRKLLAGCRSVDLTRDTAGAPLRKTFRKGFEYSDCWVDDARLVVLNARDAASRGTDIRVHTSLENGERADDHWSLTLRDANGSAETVSARAVVNAAGPWVAEVLSKRVKLNQPAKVRLVRGSHIVVKKHFDHGRSYIFQNADGRIVFAIPYEDDFTLIGTTDIDVQGDPEASTISDDEIEYLCDAVSAYFETPVRRDDIVWTYAGIRPLFDDDPNDAGKSAQKATRDYVLDFHGGDCPMLNVFGGKITTYRRLAEEAVNKFAPRFPAMGSAWTRGATLPGGDMDVEGHAAVAGKLVKLCAGLPADVALRLARTYGSDSEAVLGGAKAVADLGTHFGGGLYQSEVEYLVSQEWARCSDDVLWRRTKLGLRLNADEVSRLDAFMAERLAAANGDTGGTTAHG